MLKILNYSLYPPILILLVLFSCDTSDQAKNREGNMSDRPHNRLINEKSPYLLQHAYNPVDWYPWGEEAFRAAKEQDKPIFLSIGYSTCHWCHVMEQESFQDSLVAAMMNETFISIKVDREERPDIDDVYMAVCQMVTGSGGWPLTIIMTPDKVPFFAATYIPKTGRFNRYGMKELIPQIQRAWRDDRENIMQTAEKISAALSEASQGGTGENLTPSILDTAYTQLAQRFDRKNGGFGERPKFPTAHTLMFLMRYYQRHGDAHALEMVEKTLTEMRKGGVYDHIGFGFHRYSTDAEWLTPHFEKMLYDQAINAMAYTEAYQLTGKALYRRTAEEIFSYVLRDMSSQEGGFYSAEDADSDGEEGKFYLWTIEELQKILSPEETQLFVQVYNIRKNGNFTDEATRQKTGASIPYLNKLFSEWATEFGLSEAELNRRLEKIRGKLFAEREKRIHPLKDDKVLTDWNGLMIAALSKAAQAFDSPAYLAAAEKSADFLLATMRDKEGRLLHRYRDGHTAISGYLDDYAFLIWGLLELYEAGFDIKYLQAAQELNNVLTTHFWDKTGKGFYFTADDAEGLLVRRKEIYDGAAPSGNSTAMLNLLRLGRILGDSQLETMAAQIGNTFAYQVQRYPAGYTMLMMGLDYGLGPSYEVVITGNRAGAATQQMIGAIQQLFLPNKILLYRPLEEHPPIAGLAGFVAAMKPLNNLATAYVCKNYACELPTNDIKQMLKMLGKGE